MGIKRIVRSPWVQRGLISAGLLGAVALFVSPREIMAQVERLSPGWVALALFISVLQIMLSAWRWQFTAKRVGAPLRFSYAWREYYLALLMNQLLPGGVLGDAGRAHRHASHSGSRGSAWRAVIIERTSGQVAVVILTLAALLLSPLWHAVLGWPVSLVIVGGFCVVAAAVWQGLIRLSSPRLPAWWHSMRLDIKRGLLSPGVWNLQLASSLTIVVSYGLVMVCAARAIGVELEALQILALAPVLLLAMLVPLSVAGWGVREGAAVATWALVGLPTAQGVAVSLAYGVLVLLSSLPGIWVALSHHHTQPSGEGGGTQQHIKQGIVTTAKPTHRRTQRTFKRFDRRHLQPGSARADQQRGDQKMQAVDHACLNKLGDRNAAAFHQDALQPVLVKQCNDITGGESPLGIEWQHAALNGGTRRRKLCIWPHQMQRGRRIGVEQRNIERHPATWVEHHPRGMSAGGVAYRQLGVVCTGRASTNHHGIHQGAQPVQVHQALLTVDVMRVAAFGRNPPIQALPQLGDYPGGVARQRCQAVQQLGGCWRNGRIGMPLPLRAELQWWCAGGLAMAHSQKPLPGRLNIQQCFVTSAATWTTGVGHNASALKNRLILWGHMAWRKRTQFAATGN